MFGIRTPAKASKASNEDRLSPTAAELTFEVTGLTRQATGMSQTTDSDSQKSDVRRSIGEWESGKPGTSQLPTTPKKIAQVEAPKPKPKKALSQESRVGARRLSAEAAVSPPAQQKLKYTDRLAEARQCVTKGKFNLGLSRNIKTEYKTEITYSLERLYQLLKEEASVKGTKQNVQPEKEKELEKEKISDESVLIKRIDEHAKLIKENGEKMEKLRETIEKHQEGQEKSTYASVVAANSRRPTSEQTALHSVVVTAKNETETGEEILNRIRKAVNAKEGGIAVEKIRKAKDRKVIVGCRTEEDRQKIRERLKRAEDHLNVEEVKNKDPLVILRDVFKYNSDKEILGALWTQNKRVLKDLEKEKMEILYKKRARNPQLHHVVMRVSPRVWQRLVEAETVFIDLQRVRVADQSPLVQCSLCLGYGHGRRFCRETVEKCSHCGGPHMKAACADWLAGVAPTCCNCTRARIDRADHNAFSSECAIRRKWETLARATIAYQC